MAFRLTPPQIQFLDAEGNPLAGGQLFFYQSGTTTPASTYADAALSVPNANPIILDAHGSAPAPFLLPGQQYKIVLADENDVTIYTVDPVSDPTATGESVTSSFSITDSPGTSRTLFLQSTGKNRFGLALDASNEGGNNTGSNLVLTAYNDDGSPNDQVLTINRATGQADFVLPPTSGGSSLFPTGAVLPFAMSTVPAGWLIADGTLYSRTTYGGLFTAIGTTYGAGDGSTTFAVPDLRGVFVRGLDNSKGYDPSRTLGSYQGDALQQHAHSFTYQATNNANSNGGNIGGTANYGTFSAGGTTSGATGSTATETRPKNVALQYCIKT